MSKYTFRSAAASAVLMLLMGAVATAQEFQKSYRVGASGDIRIGNISGDVTVTGYDGDAVVVSANKEGRDRDKVEIQDRSTGDRVDVSVRYPENCNCNVDVTFDVKVPRSIHFDALRFSSVSGEVSVNGIAGKIRASVSGAVDVEIDQLDGAENMKFSSVSGSVNVRVPNNLDADISMSTLSGGLKTDFPIEVKEKRYGPGRSAHGKVGGGSRTLNISSVSGEVTLMYGGR
jgi:DUF4097 and DUF4098 domain-containing protein YvlB